MALDFSLPLALESLILHSACQSVFHVLLVDVMSCCKDNILKYFPNASYTLRIMYMELVIFHFNRFLSISLGGYGENLLVICKVFFEYNLSFRNFHHEHTFMGGYIKHTLRVFNVYRIIQIVCESYT